MRSPNPSASSATLPKTMDTKSSSLISSAKAQVRNTKERWPGCSMDFETGDILSVPRITNCKRTSGRIQLYPRYNCKNFEIKLDFATFQTENSGKILVDSGLLDPLNYDDLYLQQVRDLFLDIRLLNYLNLLLQDNIESMSVTAIAQNATTIFAHTPVNHPALIPVGLTSMGVAIIVVGLRLYTRHFLTKRLWWDDFMILIALLPSVGISVVSYYAPKYGWGHHAKDIPALESYVISVLKTLWISTMCFTLSTGLIKCAILIFYLRITANGAHRTLRNATWVTLVMTALYTIIMGILNCVQCIPTSTFWSIPDYATRAALCAPWAAKKSYYIGQGITNIIGDFVVVLLPLKYVIGLMLPIREKIILMILLCLGLLASISGILRVIYISKSFETLDTTWEGIITFQLGCLEVNTAIICASIPAIKPLVIRLFPQLDGSSPRKSSDGSSSQAPLALTTEEAEGKV